jgi:hypothetical protein
MATYTDKFSSGWATLKLEVTRKGYSTADNTSTLECVLKITKNKSCSSRNQGGAYISMEINGKELYKSNSFTIQTLGVGDTKTLATKEIEVKHNSDGTKSVKCDVDFKSKVALGSAYISRTYTCGTIARASTLSLSATSVNVGSSITANITRKNSDYKHTVRFFLNNTYYKEYTNVGTAQTFTIPTTWYNAMPTSTSCKAYCMITTKDANGKTIGDSVGQTFTVKVPSSIVPKVGTIKFDPANIKTKDGTSRDILVQGKNKFTLSVSGSTAGTGTSIKSYTFSGPGLTTTATSSNSISGGPVSKTGSVTYTVTVTDKRGRKASKEFKGTTDNKAYSYSYSKPYITDFDAYRVKQNDDGSYTKDPNGTHMEYKFTPKFSSVNGTNNYTVKRYCTDVDTYTCRTNSTSTETYTGHFKISTDKTYKIYIEITDNYKGSNTSATISVLGSFRIMNVTKGGTGIAFGKKAETGNCLESMYKIWTRKNFTVKENNYGLYTTKTDGTAEPAVFRNSSNNLWIGATFENATHITGGGTFISAGDNDAVYVNKKNGTSRSNYKLVDAENYKNYATQLYHDEKSVFVVVKDSDGYWVRPNKEVTTAVNLGSGVVPFDTVRGDILMTYKPPNSSGGSVARISDNRICKDSSSSKRYKRDIAPIIDKDIAPEKLYDATVVQFKYNDGYLMESDLRNDTLMPGFIVEDLEKSYPIAVNYNDEGLPEMWNANIMIPPMLKLIQDQKKEIDELKERLDKLESAK